MLIRDYSMISNTKKFFHKTINNFKSFFSFPRTDHHHHDHSPATYMKLPKFDVPGIDAADYDELDRFYSGFKDQYDKDRGNKSKSFKNRLLQPVGGSTDDDPQQDNASPKRLRPEFSPVNENRAVLSDLQKQRRSSMVAKKLKELEMMDKSNMDHILDIEEILHYYSRLTCPFYLDVVDKFFMQVVDEFSAISSTSTAHAS